MPVKMWREKWYADFKIDGVRIRKVSPVQTKRGALQFEAELRSAYLTSTKSSAAPGQTGPSGVAVERTPTPFREFAVEWLKTYVATNNKPSEVVNKESALRVHLIPFFENRNLDSIAARDVEHYKAAKLKDGGEGKPLSPKTINNHLTMLRKLLVTAEEWELLEKVPRIKKLSVTTPKFEWLTPAGAGSPSGTCPNRLPTRRRSARVRALRPGVAGLGQRRLKEYRLPIWPSGPGDRRRCRLLSITGLVHRAPTGSAVDLAGRTDDFTASLFPLPSGGDGVLVASCG